MYSFDETCGDLGFELWNLRRRSRALITFAQRPKNENKLGDERVPPERHNDSRNFGDECKEYKEKF